MIKIINEEDYAKLVELFTEKYPEYVTETRFFYYYDRGTQEAKKTLILIIKLIKKKFIEQKIEEKVIKKRLNTILKKMDFEPKNFIIEANTKGNRYCIFPKELD